MSQTIRILVFALQANNPDKTNCCLYVWLCKWETAKFSCQIVYICSRRGFMEIIPHITSNSLLTSDETEARKTCWGCSEKIKKENISNRQDRGASFKVYCMGSCLSMTGPYLGTFTLTSQKRMRISVYLQVFMKNALSSLDGIIWNLNNK